MKRLFLVPAVLLFLSIAPPSFGSTVAISFSGTITDDIGSSPVQVGTEFTGVLTLDTETPAVLLIPEPGQGGSYGGSATYSHTAPQFGLSIQFGTDSYSTTIGSIEANDGRSLFVRVTDDVMVNGQIVNDRVGFAGRVQRDGSPGSVPQFEQFSLRLNDTAALAISGIQLANVPLDFSAYPAGEISFGFGNLSSVNPGSGASFASINSLQVIPEPTITLLLALGLVGLARAPGGRRSQ